MYLRLLAAILSSQLIAGHALGTNKITATHGASLSAHRPAARLGGVWTALLVIGKVRPAFGAVGAAVEDSRALCCCEQLPDG